MRRLAAIALVSALMLSLAACGAGPEPPEESAPPATASTAAPTSVVNYGLPSAWDSLMPYNSPSASNYARIVYDKIYDRLAYVNADGTLSPRGAERWESVDGGLSVLFYLDSRAAFHDGAPVTAQHWADTIALMVNPDCPAMGRSSFNVLAGTTDEGVLEAGQTLGAVAVDELTLKLTFKLPSTPEDFLLARNREYYVLPTHLLEGVAPQDIMTQEIWNHPVGSGPCKFVSEVAGSQLVLESNPAYQLGAPGFGQLVLTVMDKSNLLTALLAGDLDYYAVGGNISAEDAEVARAAGLTVLEGSIPTTFYELMLNCQTVPQAEIRRAIELALDKELLCQQNAAGLGAPTDTSVLPGSPSYPYGDTPARARDLEGAKALLASAGYSGEELKLACSANRAGLAALMQQNLAEAGINVIIETVDSATMFSGMVAGDYDMAIASHTPNALPLWFVETRFTRDNNIFHMQDLTAITAGMQSVRQETDTAARAEQVRALDAYLQEQRPFIPLWFSRALHAQSPNVSGIDYPSASFSNDNVWQWKKA